MSFFGLFPYFFNYFRRISLKSVHICHDFASKWIIINKKITIAPKTKQRLLHSHCPGRGHYRVRQSERWGQGSVEDFDVIFIWFLLENDQKTFKKVSKKSSQIPKPRFVKSALLVIAPPLTFYDLYCELTTTGGGLKILEFYG